MIFLEQFANPLLEEIGFRLFLMGGIAWLLSRSTDDRRSVFLVALAVSALVFGPLHLLRPPAGLLDATVVVLKAGGLGCCSAGSSGGGGCRTRLYAMA
jgi:membrane protease YdiL (CAAX protease family)